MNHYFFIYRSSAGSGKTFTLVKEYLFLALQDPHHSYKHILAITFTNKAMQEMKNRIIGSLADFTEGKSNPMKEELIKKLGISDTEFTSRCKILLEKILHQYSYFSISTIDAFFQRIIRSFTKELGLYGQYQLELDLDLVKIQAIDNMLSDLKEDQVLTKWVVKFAEEQLDEGKNWNIKRSLAEFAGELFKEQFIGLKGKIPSTTEIVTLQKSLLKEIKIVENQLIAYSKEALEILGKNNISIEELKYKASGAIAFLYKINEGTIDNPGNRVIAGCTDVGEWISKSSPRYDFIASTIEEKIMPILNDAISYYTKNSERYYTAIAASRYIYGLGLLSELSDKILTYKQDRDILFIQDATRLIKTLMDESDSSFIFEKAGTFFNHYLIDEFQDTSALQWQCLQPLVTDTISQGNMSMIVGDTKQSIYRWRGGDWSLLQQQVITDIAPQTADLLYLNKNFRSGGNIINFNNSLFDTLPKLLLASTAGEMDNSSKVEKLIDNIAGVYTEAAQKIPENKEQQGYINLQFIQDDEEDEWKEQALSLTIDKIEDVLARGYSLRDIALLVRKKDEAALLAQHLLSFTTPDGEPQFPVLTNEALLIKNSHVVMVIINALRYLHSPADEIALSELIYSYHSITGISNSTFHEWLDENKILKENILPFNLKKEKLYLQNLPIEEAVEHLIRLFKLPGDSGEEAYLQTFQDKVLEFGRAEGNDIAAFLFWWDEKGSRESINVPSGLDAITLMTIHKAKGLQFPIVIVPFTCWGVDSNNKTTLWANTDEKPFQGINVPLHYSKGLLNTIFKDEYIKEKYQAALDSINMLYVAFTRAEQELYAFAPEKSRSSEISNYLYGCIDNENFELYPLWTPQHDTFEMGEKRQVEGQKKESTNQVKLEKYVSYNWRDRLVVKKVSPGTSAPLTEALRGTEMHHLLSKIKYDEDLTEKSFFKSLDNVELIQQLNEVISHPEIAQYFTKEYTVLNEKSILSETETFRPDRVVIKNNEAVIIDYKWGQKQDKYARQIKTYLNLLSTMGYSKTAGYLYYVDQKSIEKVA